MDAGQEERLVPATTSLLCHCDGLPSSKSCSSCPPVESQSAPLAAAFDRVARMNLVHAVVSASWHLILAPWYFLARRYFPRARRGVTGAAFLRDTRGFEAVAFAGAARTFDSGSSDASRHRRSKP